MKLLFSTFLAAALVSNSHAAKPRVRMTPKSSKAAKTSTAFSSVYAMTNQPNNEILVYSRDESSGLLTFENSVETGGDGSRIDFCSGPPADSCLPMWPNDPLASQSSVYVSGKCLLNVNAGTNDVSTFRIISSSEIEFASKQPTNGLFPNSVTARGGLAYVLNAGGNGSIQGYKMSEDCVLNPIGGPIALIQGGGETSDDVTPVNPPWGAASPSHVGFTPEGKILVIIKILGGGQNTMNPGDGALQTFVIDPDTGTASLEHSTLVTGRPNASPFAFQYDHRGRLIVAEVFPTGQPAQGITVGGVTLWEDAGDGAFDQVGTTLTTGFFSCWLTYDSNNGCAYLTNSAPAGSVSSFAVGDEIVLVDALAGELNGPLEIVSSVGGEHVYALSPGVSDGSGQPHIFGYQADSGCHLEQVQAISDGFENEQDRRDAGNNVFNGVNGLAIYPNPN